MGIQIDCCPEGWAVICMGSRFLTQAEKNYSAVEGDLLGITWALEKTKFWTMGNEDLNIFTDHKPLIGLLQNRDFDKIGNPRIARMVEKTLRWGFKIHHIPGLQNSTCDDLSRFLWGQEGDKHSLEFEEEFA